MHPLSQLLAAALLAAASVVAVDHLFPAGEESATLALANAPAPAITPAKPPASGCSATEIIDLRRWKLTLPAGDSESLTEILPSALRTVTSTFFAPTERCDGVAFRAPVTGSTTKGSNYPRSELRELGADGSPAAWSSSAGTHSIAVMEAFTALPKGKPELVGLQIHDAADDVSVFRLEGNKLYVTSGDDPHHQLIDPDYRLGTVFTAAYLVTNNTIWAYYNGRAVARLPGRLSGAYFKAGAYTQANCSNSSPCQASNYGETVIHALRVQHG
jgi:hypothetical protein